MTTFREAAMSDLMQQLSGLRREDVIEDIDLELCRFLRRHYPDLTKNVLLAACLVSYLYRQGDVCLLLEKYANQPLFKDGDQESTLNAPPKEQWIEELQEAPVVGSPGEFKPLILDASGRLYMHKLWHYENALAEELVTRSKQKEKEIDVELLQDGLERLFPNSDEGIQWQQVAAATAVKNKLSVISGGPGTGKTSTVVRVLALLLEQAESRKEEISIALTAPTGKAAARLKDSILSTKQELDITENIRAAIPEEAMTLHQLLGARRHSSSFKHDEDNPVPCDVVVVDEASMVDQALMSKLMNALLKDSSVVLLGDKDQLASVEAGSVLGDICDIDENWFSEELGDWFEKISLSISPRYITDNPNILTDNITLLTKSYRFDEHSGIAQLAKSVNKGDSNSATQALKSDKFTDISLLSAETLHDLKAALRSKIVRYFRSINESDSADEALQVFNEFQILAAHRRGPWGIEYLNKIVENILQEEGLISRYEHWYPGKPVIINVNNYQLDLYNGDIGICLPDKNGEPYIHFRHEDTIRTIVPGRLPDNNTAYALTVHKSQGSEFDRVLLVLPESLSQVVTRELIYTAITRARTAIDVLAPEEVFRKAIQKQLLRSSGLRDRLWNV